MIPISIKFQAYIPKNLGKPLLSYFKNDPRLNYLINKNDFLKKLSDIDKGSKGYWIPEPLSNSYYFSTDDTYIHNCHTEHTMRLGFHLNIEPDKIGKYKDGDYFTIHKEHGKDWGGVNSQHSGLSHRVEAYIRRIPFYDDKPRLSNKDIYLGVCKIHQDRSDENPLDILISNPKKYFFSNYGNETTTIIVSSSAGYPFAEPFSPNIDFKLEIEFHKNLSNKSIDIMVKGTHDKFPAYELIVNEQVIYLYNPSEHGQTGPNIFNLNMSKDFIAHKLIWRQDR